MGKPISIPPLLNIILSIVFLFALIMSYMSYTGLFEVINNL